MDRRKFLSDSGVFSAAILGGTSAFSSLDRGKMPALPAGMHILFQGDSITDAGRNRGNYYANAGNGMGGGYVYQIVAELLGSHPDADLKCFNRGISGHKVYQLADRWDLDCLALEPDVLSVLIGVNDYWHMIEGRYDGNVEVYENDFSQLLKRTKKALPDIKLIVGEPFAVAGGTAIDHKWAAFDDYRAAAKRVASEFDAAFIPYHQIFNDALTHAPAAYWCPDGVHPSLAGAHLMKEAWLKTFEEMLNS